MRSRGIPDPEELRHRFGHSREELAQRAVASLVVGREPAAWNRPEAPTGRGLAFLRRLDPFGDVAGEVAFVDEFELPARHDAEKAGWPDWAVIQSGRILLIELKTERASHTPGQRERYLDLGRHHHPAALVDLVYVTPPMTLAAPAARQARRGGPVVGPGAGCLGRGVQALSRPRRFTLTFCGLAQQRGGGRVLPMGKSGTARNA